MRASEFIWENAQPQTAVDSTAQVLSVLRHLADQTIKTKSQGQYSMDSVVTMVKNAGADQFNYESFVDLFEKNPDQFKNLVKNFNQQHLQIRLPSDSEHSTSTDQETQQQARTVDQMAKSAVDI